jgi:hypothetical protein
MRFTKKTADQLTVDMPDVLQILRDQAEKNKCGTIAARMKNGELIILVTKDAENPEKDILLAMSKLFHA